MKAHTSFLSSFFVGIVLLAGCVSDYKEDITDLKNRVTALENLCSQINGNIASLQSLVTAVQNRNYITAVTPITSGGETTGYTVAFATGDPITIYNGAKGADGSNGQDGHTPQIGVKQDTDGLWYWTVDGEWLLAPDGQKVKAVGEDGKDGTNGTNGTNGINGTNGADGVTPILKIEDDYWYVSTDKGATWTKLDKARGDDGAPGKDGDSFFKSVTQDDNNVYFTLTDNTVITIPKASLLEISFDPDGEIALEVGFAEDIAYTVTSSLTPVKVEVVSSSNIEVKVTPADEDGLAGTMTVMATSDVNEFSKIVVMVDNGARMIMRSLKPVAPISHESVDLGLPSGIKWATCNVGAENPEDYGDYFAWGDTEPYYTSLDPVVWKSSKSAGYGWQTYMWCSGGNYKQLTKYNTTGTYGPVIDNKLTLDPEDDAARANWGPKWRMPTKKEIVELLDINNTTSEWTTQNGVYGKKITSKKNGNSIFLPATGGWDAKNHHEVAAYGYYWSSSIYPVTPHRAFHGIINSNSAYMPGNGHFRCRGFSVRPVTDIDVRVQVVAIMIDKTSLSMTEGETYSITATVLPSNATQPQVIWSSSDTEVATVSYEGVVTAIAPGSATITATTYDGGNTATCAVVVVGSNIENGHEWVDLGLPSGLKWATCNVGAVTPGDNGDYFAWGEISAKKDYKWYTYIWCEGSGTTIKKYNTKSEHGSVVDNKVILDLEDDAASSNWGGKWRMPTKADFEELFNINNCTSEWTTENEVKGRKITSVKNGNSIFLPVAGYQNGTGIAGAGIYGYYFSASLNSDNPTSAHCLIFGEYTAYVGSGINRFYGGPVRPVFTE